MATIQSAVITLFLEKDLEAQPTHYVYRSSPTIIPKTILAIWSMYFPRAYISYYVELDIWLIELVFETYCSIFFFPYNEWC